MKVASFVGRTMRSFR